MTLSQCLSCPIRTLLFSRPPCYCNYGTTRTATTTATIPKPNWSQFRQFRAHPVVFLTPSPKPISKFHPFSLYTSGSRSISHARVSTTPGEEATDISKLRVLKQKIEVLGIDCDSCTPGRYNLLICPKCKGGQSMERGLSFHISENGNFAMWRCFRVECGWAGQAFADNSTMYNGGNEISKVNFPGQMTVESLGLVPLTEKLIAYFAERMISKNILWRNAVMQMSGDQNVIAFTYRRNGVLVSCKYRSLDKKFWQEKGTEKILYGLDDIKEADEIIIVEGEIDKLSMEEAGFRNCVSVPDGAPQKVSAKELPSFGKSLSFHRLTASLRRGVTHSIAVVADRSCRRLRRRSFTSPSSSLIVHVTVFVADRSFSPHRLTERDRSPHRLTERDSSPGRCRRLFKNQGFKTPHRLIGCCRPLFRIQDFSICGTAKSTWTRHLELSWQLMVTYLAGP